jgi:hypothetical protein
LFDILARYRIAKVEYNFSELWHWENFEGIEFQSTAIWASDDFQIDLGDLQKTSLRKPSKTLRTNTLASALGKLTGLALSLSMWPPERFQFRRNVK